jgi:hypothetical protein
MGVHKFGNRGRTTKYMWNARGSPFLRRLPIARIQRSMVLEYVKAGRIRPWYRTKEAVVGCPITLNFDYNPRPVRLIGTVMDAHCSQTSLQGGIKVYARNEEANISLWVPAGNPKLRYELTHTRTDGAFEQYLDERDKWDEAWQSGRARIH